MNQMKKQESGTPTRYWATNTYKHIQAQSNIPFTFYRKHDIEPLTFLCPILERDMEGMENIWLDVSDIREQFCRFIISFLSKKAEIPQTER